MPDKINWEDVITINCAIPEVRDALEAWLCTIENSDKGQDVFKYIKDNALFNDGTGRNEKLEVFGFNESVQASPEIRNRFDFIPVGITPFAREEIAEKHGIGILRPQDIGHKNIRYVVVNFNQEVAQNTSDPEVSYSPSIERFFHELTHASGIFGDYENYAKQFSVDKDSAEKILRETTASFQRIEENVTDFTDGFAKELGLPNRGGYKNMDRKPKIENAILDPKKQLSCDEYTEIANTIKKLKDFDNEGLTPEEIKFLKGFKAENQEIVGFSSIMTDNPAVNWTPEIAKNINTILDTLKQDGDNLSELVTNDALLPSLVNKLYSPVMKGKINNLTDGLGL